MAPKYKISKKGQSVTAGGCKNADGSWNYLVCPKKPVSSGKAVKGSTLNKPCPNPASVAPTDLRVFP